MGKVLDYQCPSCNAPLHYKAKTKNWKCDYCDTVFTIEELKQKKKSIDDVEVTDKELVFDQYNCPDCGASVVCDKTTSATFCIYCGNTSILKNRLSGEFRPSKVIPFSKTKEDAIDAFVALKKGRPFMPNLFNDPKNVEKITGVYIPFWLYDIKAEGEMNVSGKRVSSWTSGEYHYTKTDIYEFLRGGSMEFKQIPVDGATKFDNAMMNSIEPFNFDELVDFDPAYLSGFLAEMYDVDSEESMKEANMRAKNSSRDEVYKTITATGLVTKEDNMGIQNINTEYVLLPVWMVNVKYKDKMHLFAMNGQTGEIIGNIPLDPGKVLLYTSIVLILTVLVTIGVLVLFTGGF